MSETSDAPAESVECCENCRFYKPPQTGIPEALCRRRAPTPYDFLKYYELELLREIAWSIHALAQLPQPSEFDDLNIEATEAASMTTWPIVEPDEWCGEWEIRR
jgi:hypothetical protein